MLRWRLWKTAVRWESNGCAAPCPTKSQLLSSRSVVTSITYRFRTKNLQFVRSRVQGLTRSTNSIYRLLCDFIGNLFTHNLESGDGAEQVPGLSFFQSLRGNHRLRNTHLEEDRAAFHLVQWLTAVPRGRQSTRELRHCKNKGVPRLIDFKS